MTTISGMTKDAPSDQQVRNAIVAERTRNVAVVAGAGTGKTKTIIDRAVELLAPRTPGATPISIQRLAALTFTRRAAGELRLRVREQLLRELEHAARSDNSRTELLRDALSNLDAAFIGTIHGFADRLLRLRPVEAKLSPAYALTEDTSELVGETFARLRRAAEAGNLPAALGTYNQGLEPSLVLEAGETLRAAARAGLQMERAEGAYGPLPSLEAVLASMIDSRDIEFPLPELPDPGLNAARLAAQRMGQMVKSMRGNGPGQRRLRRISHALRQLNDRREPGDAAEAFRIVQDAWRGRPLYQRDFDGDTTGWSIYKALRPENTKADSLADQLRGPHRWLAARLVRLFRVLQCMYRRVKDEHEVVDYLDLLVKLRDVLRDNRAARAFYQGLFDHIFVDEFQDTDPLQCEIVFFLCEDGAKADRWDQARLKPGRLTIVGDPKQSIYRFRRADVVMYDRATQLLRRGGAFEQQLTTNFRSRPELIEFFNAQLGKLLGSEGDGPVDTSTGRAVYEDLTPDPKLSRLGVSVHALPYAGLDGEALLAGNGRPIEAKAVARYIRWLLGSGRTVRDADTGEERPLRPCDIAVLACVTTHLPWLLEQLDTLEIEYNARGGVLFLAHPVVRQYLLGLRSLADRDDGVAQAALLQPPFFALDFADLVAGQQPATTQAHSASRIKLEGAKAIIADLRARRFQCSPGTTARHLIEQTALGRAVATGRNGRQTLAALYEIAWEVDRRAAREHLDYDRVTEAVRWWAEAPVFLEAPEPLGEDAVRVMSIHQAKGLEFPVVILWDGFQTLSDRGAGLWRLERDGASWALSLGAISVEHPLGSGLIARERTFGESERRRMYYVAATRARDLLVLPLPTTKSDRLPYANKMLAQEARPAQIWRLDSFIPEDEPEWACGPTPAGTVPVHGNARLDEEIAARAEHFRHQLEAAGQAVALPTAMTREARVDDEAHGGMDSERTQKAAGARFGPQFGIGVHRALELLLSGACHSAATAVQLAAVEAHRTSALDSAGTAAGGDTETLLVDKAEETLADVERTLITLRNAGITTKRGWKLFCEYPVYDMQLQQLLSGFIDLLALSDTEGLVIDFKSDQPSPGDAASAYPAYARQLRLYRRALERSGRVGGRRLRLGLLLTATGELRWL